MIPTVTGGFSPAQVKDALAKSGNIEQFLSAMEAVSESAGGEIAAQVATTQVAERTAIAIGIVTVCKGLGLFAVTFAGIGAVLGYRWAKGLLLEALSHMPGWIAGPIRTALGPLLAWDDAIAGWIAQVTYGGYLQMVTGLIAIIRPVARSEVRAPTTSGGSFVGPPSNMATKADVRYVQNEIDSIQASLGYAKPPTSMTTVINAVPQALVNQLHEAQHSISAIESSLVNIAHTVNLLNSRVTAVEHQQSKLSSEVHDVRAIQVGVDDLERQVETLGNSLSGLAATVKPELTRHTSQINHLLPLGLLLEPGVRGLRNLRKLEDNICQCPRFGGIGNDLGTELALLEFIENG